MLNQKQRSLTANGLIISQENFISNGVPNKQNIQIQKEKSDKKYGLISMFRFADRIDTILIILGAIFALITGATVPIFSLLWGSNIDNFKTADDLVQQTYNNLLKFIYIGLGVLVSGWIMITCWSIAGQRQSIKCKRKYLECLLSQEVGWFQCTNQYQISSSYSVDTAAYQNAISHNMTFILYCLGMMISGLTIAFSKGWLMSLVIIVAIPVLVISKYIYSTFILNKHTKEQEYYSEAGGRAEQALFSIKTVKMLNGQKYQLEKFVKSLINCRKKTQKFFLLFGISVGCAFFFNLSAFAFSLWYGSHCVRNTSSCPESVSGQSYTVGLVFTIFFSVMTISFHMSHLPDNIKKVMIGIGAIQRIFKVIDRQPLVKNPQKGIKLNNFKGIIRFNNVTFSYPKDPNKIVLNGLSLEINKKKIAFVGKSGCGKSTIIQLIMRFYDPVSGEITVDGINLKDIDLVWWRQEMIGYVGQEPVLFATTIKQNLLFSAENSTEEQLTQALRKAKIFDFINSLEKKMDTYVGSGGCQVSGGQKQRIAIARAIVRKPKMLILDEATSALDRKTEKQIQSTLNQISNDVFSLTIAHRTKTIMNSDQIFVIENGKVKQSGRFEELEMFKNARAQLEKEEDIVQKQIQRVDNKQEQIEDLKQDKLEKPLQKNESMTKRLIAYYKQTYLLLFFAFIMTALIGGAFPVSTIFLADLTEQMLIPNNPNLGDEANRNTLIVFLISIGELFACIIQIILLERVGESVGTKIRVQTFSKLLNLPIHWHDKEQNNVSSVASKLSLGAIRIREVTTSSVFAALQILLCLISGLVIAFIYEWRLALIQIAFLPFTMATAGFTAKYRSGLFSGQNQELASSGIINQAVTNIKTVYSLVYEKKILKNYIEVLLKPVKKNMWRAIISGFFYGLGECLVFILISALYHIGSIFVRDNDVPVKNVFTVIFAMFFATVSMGQMSNAFPNIQKCMESTKQIFKILDSKDEEQIQVEQNSKMIKDIKIQGNIELKNIKFKYPSRSSYLFNDLNLKVEKGKKVGFVGYSGCGKSTIMSFLLRFYEPESGEIIIDGINIKDYDIHFLRSKFGVVSQQPVIFNTSYKQNIQYNMKVPNESIIKAAKMANAIDFINKQQTQQQQIQTQYVINENFIESSQHFKGLVSIRVQKFQKDINIQNFNRVVGVKGGSISGGQKQRVAIARAILRNPEILLLDQATSALDSENEKKVIDCLDKIMENKTTISIAHKLQTIRNSDLIYVFNRGIIVEQGTYDSLLEKKGYFYKLEKGIELL